MPQRPPSYIVVAWNKVAQVLYRCIRKNKVCREKSEQYDYYDIAIIKLTEPLEFNELVKKAQLPQPNVYPTGKAIVSGWGCTSQWSREESPVLQALELPLVSERNTESLRPLRQLADRHIREQVEEKERSRKTDEERENRRIAEWESAKALARKVIHTHSPKGKPWKGDSGGPLSQNGVVIGIVISAYCSNNIATYTSVSEYREWIEMTISEMQGQQRTLE